MERKNQGGLIRVAIESLAIFSMFCAAVYAMSGRHRIWLEMGILAGLGSVILLLLWKKGWI